MNSAIQPKQAHSMGGGYPKEPGRISWTSLLATYRWQARKRNLSFELTLEQFITVCSKPCFYCGLPPQEHNCYHKQPKNKRKVSEETRSRATIYKSGLDRTDNLKGYELGNVIPCCRQCNWAKGTLSVTEFLAWIARLIKRVTT